MIHTFLNTIFLATLLISSPAICTENNDFSTQLKIISSKLDALEEKLDSIEKYFTDSKNQIYKDNDLNIEDKSYINNTSEEDIEENLSKKLFSEYSVEQELYDKAFILMKNGKHDEAELQFEMFISKFPNSKLLQNANYWIAEINFNAKKFKNAAVYFVKAYKAESNGMKAPISLLKLATSLKEINEIEHSCSIINKLFNNFPELAKSLKNEALSLKSKIKCE